MTTVGDAIVAFAQQQIGKPYVFGAKGPDAWDCSGLVYGAYKAAGLPVTYKRAVDLGRSGTAVSAASAVPGDVVYYDEPGDTDHVGIYVGNGQMIDAPTEGKPVERVGIGNPTSIRHLDGVTGGTAAANAQGQTEESSGGLLDALNPLSLFSHWQSDVTALGLKILAGGACAALVIAGAYEALHEKGNT